VTDIVAYISVRALICIYSYGGHNHWHAVYNVAKGHKSNLEVHEKVPCGCSYVLNQPSISSMFYVHFSYEILAPKITNLKRSICNFLAPKYR